MSNWKMEGCDLICLLCSCDSILPPLVNMIAFRIMRKCAAEGISFISLFYQSFNDCFPRSGAMYFSIPELSGTVQNYLQ